MNETENGQLDHEMGIGIIQGVNQFNMSCLNTNHALMYTYIYIYIYMRADDGNLI